MFSKYLTTALIIGVALGVSACRTTPPPKPMGVKVTGEELAAWYMSGKSTTTESTSLESGRSYVITRDGAGRQQLSASGGSFTDTGSYRIEGDMVCNKWKVVREGQEKCFVMYALPDGTYEVFDENGVKTSTLRAPSTS